MRWPHVRRLRHDSRMPPTLDELRRYAIARSLFKPTTLPAIARWASCRPTRSARPRARRT